MNCVKCEKTIEAREWVTSVRWVLIHLDCLTIEDSICADFSHDDKDPRKCPTCRASVRNEI